MRVTLILFLGLLLSACGPVKEVDTTLNWTVEKLYRSARSHMDDGNYLTAIEQYETLESRFPFGKYATQAQLDVAYAYYKFDEHESSIAAIERFIKLNPRHESVDYAYYLRGLINFNRGGGILDKLHDRDNADYDKSILVNSYDDFQLLIRRFPTSAYAEDSRQRMIYLREQIARADLKVAQYYASRDAWVAAANRTKTILQDYQGTAAVEAALKLQLQAYENLGLEDLADDTRRIIELNYSNGS
ncbi:MAG: outer membrane protein assembly factor BamD [Gammaproteobacteria bacterium]|nr:outer membrane protein assembly factor BamD [Gammaproteobacteria bacterium]